VLADPFDVVHGRSLSVVMPRGGRAPDPRQTPVCLGKVVPDSEAAEYWIARLRGR
jgi:hypothetical protein